MIRIINQHKEEPKVYKVNCDCGCKFECEKSDMSIGYCGFYHVTCPACERDVYMEDIEPLKIDENNLLFPAHFYYFDEDAVDVSNEVIQKWAREQIKDLKTRGGDFDISSSGNAIIITLDVGDEYYTMVAKNYWDLAIPK